MTQHLVSQTIFFLLLSFSAVAQTKADFRSLAKAETFASPLLSNNINTISLVDVPKHMGETVTVCGKVYQAKLLNHVKGKPTLMNLGGAYANERVEIRINFNQLAHFNYDVENLFLQKNVCITGTLSNKHGFNEISVDTFSLHKMINEALAEQVTIAKTPAIMRLRLLDKAYLLAGPGWDEPIVTHLKAGSVVIPEYTINGWSYVKVAEKADTGEKPLWMYGFIKSSVAGLSKKGKLAADQKRFLGLRL
ncbi:hypothetical protein [Aridibaculum aurantiacum]|uniref:hypothetical protein n=1 Tax=Aridibaculum aurantiacum TaxID=2810307 RepID=UPI001A956F80|nr:hypothetical protein [Aridibaculum aurantiacum]